MSVDNADHLDEDASRILLVLFGRIDEKDGTKKTERIGALRLCGVVQGVHDRREVDVARDVGLFRYVRSTGRAIVPGHRCQATAAKRLAAMTRGSRSLPIMRP